MSAPFFAQSKKILEKSFDLLAVLFYSSVASAPKARSVLQGLCVVWDPSHNCIVSNQFSQLHLFRVCTM